MRNYVVVCVASFILGILFGLLIAPKVPAEVFSYLAQGFGVLLGVLAGVFIMIIIHWLEIKVGEAQMLENFKCELKIDIKKIDQWLAGMEEYRNAVNSNTVHQFFKYFDLSRFLSYMINNLLYSGAIYKHLTSQEVSDLFEALSFFTQNNERYLMDQLDENRTIPNQAKGKQDVDYWERALTKHKNAIVCIVVRLENKGTKKAG